MMDFYVSIWVVFGIPFSLFSYCVIYNVYFHPLRDIPGPLAARISNFHLLGTFLRGEQHTEQINFHIQYGPIVRIAPNLVIVNDPAYFQAYCNWDKSVFWRAFRPHPVYFTHANAPTNALHNDQKKLIMPAYQMSVVTKYESKIDKHISTLTERLRQRAGTIIDFAPWTQYAAFDIVMDVVFSNPMGFLEQAKDVNGLIASIHGLLNAVLIPGIFPFLSKIIHHPWVFPYVAPKPTDPTGPGFIHGIAYQQVQNRFRDLQDSNIGFNDILQDIINKTGTEKMPSVMLEQESVATIFAGSDTVAAHLRAAVLHIVTNPRVLAKFRGAIDQADAEGLLSDEPTFDEIRRHIPYIELVHKEALRIYPIVGTYFPREVPGGGTTICGYALPEGTDVGFSHWAISRNPKVWGDDHQVFRPERWENPESSSASDTTKSVKESTDLVPPQHDEKKPDESAAQTARRLRDSGYVFFLAGSTMCTGRYVAQMEIYKILTTLFRDFDMQIVDPTRPWKQVNKLAMMQSEFWVIFTERERAARKREKIVDEL